MPATVEALKGKQVDAILVPQPFPGATEAQGFGKILASPAISTRGRSRRSSTRRPSPRIEARPSPS